MGFKERYLEEFETVRNNPKTSTALTAATAGGIGYGIGTGKIQQGWDTLKKMTPNEVKDSAVNKTTEAVDQTKTKVAEAGEHKIGDMLNNTWDSLKDAASNAKESIMNIFNGDS